jgi:two-component sensor histidine kinase
MPIGEARHALEESERRVRSIALVHEILSRDTTDDVDFNDIVPPLARMTEDMGGGDRPVHITCHGEAGNLEASVATPLAVALNELLQNAAEHARPLSDPAEGDTSQAPIEVRVDMHRDGKSLKVRVHDNGIGLPDGFSVEASSSLGLSIVNGLVCSQLGGTITMFNQDGAVVEITVPLDHQSDDFVSI